MRGPKRDILIRRYKNGSGDYDQTLTATDLSFEASGAASIGNNYDGMNAVLASRLPPLPTVNFNGEDVATLRAEMRVKHGIVNLSGTATVGDPDAAGGAPRIKETMDGVFVNDGYGGTDGSANVYSDNGTSERYDLPDGLTEFPSLNDPTLGYSDHRAYLSANAAVIHGDLTLRPGDVYSSPIDPKGYISVDASGRAIIKGIVIVTGNVYIEPGTGGFRDKPIEYDGSGTLVANGDMHINTHVISKDEFPTDDAMGFVANPSLYVGTGTGPPKLNLTGAFFAQNEIESRKDNSVAGAMLANHFRISEVPSIYHAPTLADHLPPGMPGGTKYTGWIWKRLNWTWHEL